MRLTLLYKIIGIYLLMIMLSFMIPIFNVQTELIIIPATFLFGTLYGFEILLVLGNFSELKKLLATETANLVYIYHVARSLGAEFSASIEERIEKYVLTSIDYSLRYHVSSTDQDFISIIEPLEKVSIKGESQQVALESIHKGFNQIIQSRYQLGQVAPREVGIPEWIMLLLLALILVTTLFLGREAGFIPQISTGIFAATVIGTLLLLDEADSNHIQETRLEYEIFNQVLEDIGKHPYYPEFAIKKGIIHHPRVAKYRLGKFPQYPNLSSREIVFIEKE